MQSYLNLLGTLGIHTFTTFIEALAGLLTGALTAALFFFFVLRFPRLGKISLSAVLSIQIIPFIALMPLAVLLFGFGVSVKIGIVAWMSFFPSFLGFMRGYKEIPLSYHYLFQTLQATDQQKFFHLTLPFLRPYFFSGLKSSSIWAVSAAIAAEGMGSEWGLGVYFARSLSLFRLDLVFYGALASGLCGYILYHIVVLWDYSNDKIHRKQRLK